jgi:hypothetical protein
MRCTQSYRGADAPLWKAQNHLLPLTHASVLTRAILSNLRAGAKRRSDDPR